MKKVFICLECNKEFIKLECQNPKFCSRKCKNNHQKKLIGKDSPSYKGALEYKHTCKFCNIHFKGKKDRIYCSNRCKGKDQDCSYLKGIDHRGDKNPRWLGDKLKKICPFCRKDYRAYRITQVFCSKECWRKDLSDKMKWGKAAYMNSLITNPSRPQVLLYNKTLEIYSDAVLNYPLKGFSIDIAIIDKKIAIEYDGSYWHNAEKDKIRQSAIEKEGWRFIRYVDRVPDIKELKEDIRVIINVKV